MIGADQCPNCWSENIALLDMPDSGDTVAGCIECQTLWEPFDPAALCDPDDPHSAFKQMCDNCAFRPDSPERQDPEGWTALIESMGYRGIPFMCHKGLPLSSEEGQSHVHPVLEDGRPDFERERPCRGWIAHKGKLHTLLPPRQGEHEHEQP